MNQTKEKSAVGMAVPATEQVNPYTTSVTDKTEKIKCVLQKPGEISVVVNIPNTLEAMQRIVGGDIETLTLSNGYLHQWVHAGAGSGTDGKNIYDSMPLAW